MLSGCSACVSTDSKDIEMWLNRNRMRRNSYPNGCKTLTIAYNIPIIGEMSHKIFTMPFADVYPHYVTKVEKKGRSEADLREIITWLTGHAEADIDRHVAEKTTFEEFFADATMNANTPLITGVVCGVRVEEIEDPLMQKIRWLDKLVDELARGKKKESILRG